MTFSQERLKNPESSWHETISPASLTRNAIAIALLGIAWTKLSRWYVDEVQQDYYIFAVCFVGALVLAGAKQISELWRQSSRWRFFLAISLIFIALPWSEWFQRALPVAREDWSRQIFFQCCIIYGLMLLLNLFPSVRTTIDKFILRAIYHLQSSFLLWIPAVFFFLCFGIVYLVYDRTPLVQDSAAHLFQAKIFLAGKLVAPQPPFPEAFSSPGDMLVLHDGKWYSSYLPGFSFILALASIFRFEWLICPLLGAVTIYVWMQYAQRYHGTKVAVVLGLLCLFSPMLILMHSNLMVHVAELFYSSAILYLCRRQTDSYSGRRSVGISILLFMAVVTRGFSIIPFIGPVFLFTFFKIHGSHRFRFALFSGTGVMMAIILIGIYQHYTTGSFWTPGYMLESSEHPYMGFHGEFFHQRHSPLRGLENVSNNFIAMGSWLSGWPTGSLFFLLLFVLVERNIQDWDLCLFSCCLALAVFFFFFVFQDLVIGPRYWFSMVPVLLLFVARSIFTALDRNSNAAAIALVAFLISVAFLYPHYIRMYAPQHGQVGLLHKSILHAPARKAVIVLDRRVEQNYVNWNDPFLRDNVLIVNRLAENNSELRRAFPDRKVFYFRESLAAANKMDLVSSYHLMPSPDSRPAGSFSMQQFILMIESANNAGGFDIFDSSYRKLFNGMKSSDCLSYLSGMDSYGKTDPEYRRALKSGAIHLARAILLPKLAFQMKGDDWRQTFNINLFREELVKARSDASRAGEPGKELLEQMDQIRARMDRDQDEKVSDPEIFAYLSKKMRILAIQDE